MVKKYGLCLILFSHVIVAFDESMLCDHEIYQELIKRRWPQFLVNFYQNIKDTLAEVSDNISSLPQKFNDLYVLNHPYAHTTAQVRFSDYDDIGPEEKEFVALRLTRVQKSLEKIFNITLDQERIPKIGMIFSGGGIRSMLTTTGFLHGAQQTGILDCTLYCATLSGSTWGLASWIASREPISLFKTRVINSLQEGMNQLNEPHELNPLLNIFITKLLSGQYISAIDIYGAILANTFLSNVIHNPIQATITQTHAHILSGNYPLPIYTAIQTYHEPYEWMELTPFEVGSSFLKSYIPTWAFGRTFNNGVSTNYAPEQTLGYFLGVFGSAFEVSLKDLVKMSASNLSFYGNQLPSLLATGLKKCLRLILSSFIGDTRLFPSVLFNYTFGFPHSPTGNTKTVGLVDAGIDFNLPFPPLLRTARDIDILIVYDSSATITGVPELKKACAYAQRNNLRFPEISSDHADKQIMNIFMNQDMKTPIIIYFPRIKNNAYSLHFDPEICINSSYCNTFNFTYSPEQALLITELPEFTIKQKKHAIYDTIKQVLIQRYGYKPEEFNNKYAMHAKTQSSKTLVT